MVAQPKVGAYKSRSAAQGAKPTATYKRQSRLAICYHDSFRGRAAGAKESLGTGTRFFTLSGLRHIAQTQNGYAGTKKTRKVKPSKFTFAIIIP